METLLLWVKIVVGTGMGLVVLLFVVWPLLRALGQPIATETPTKPPHKFPPPNNDAPKADVKPKATEIVELAKKDPVFTAQQVRRWLKEKDP
ncbi:MAG: hypothetical protein RRB13_13990 [bacterium]|nr:hypothetical protein [bacterium]